MKKRRQFSATFKAELVLSVLSGVKSQAEVCREYHLTPQIFNRWKSQLLEHAHELFQTDEQRSAEQRRIAELEQALGRKTLELEIAKKVSSILTSASNGNGRP
jgi:transposase